MLFKYANKLALFEEFLREKKRLAESSIYVYTKALEQFLVTGPNLDELEDYNKFLIAHSVKKRSRHFYSVLKTFIEFNAEDAYTKNKLVEGLIRAPEPPRMKKERAYLPESQRIKLINNLTNDKHKIIALLQTTTGIRAGDVLRIRRGAIMPETYQGENVLKIVIVGKGNKRNTIFLHEPIIQKLVINYIVKNFNDEEYYFIERSKYQTHKRVSFNTSFRNNYNQYLLDFKQSMDLLGIDEDSFATHDLRRCYARDVWTRWKDLEILQSLLNHADPKTTMRYLKGSGLKNIDYHKEMQTN